MAQRRGVEEELDIGDGGAGAIGAQHVLEVADAHVVALGREILAPGERPPRGREVAPRRGQGGRGVKALIDAATLCRQLRRPPTLPSRRCLSDLRCQASARGLVDAQAKEVARRLAEDLREPGGCPRSRRRERVGPAGAFEEDDRLESVGVAAAGPRCGLDEWAQRRYSLGRGDHAAGALGVEHVRVASGRPLLVVGGASRRVGERVGRSPAAGCAEERAGDGGDQRERRNGDEQGSAALASLHRHYRYQTPRRALTSPACA